MKIEVMDDHGIALKEVYSGVLFISDDKEEFGICMRDSGFEFKYAGQWYEAKGGTLQGIAKLQHKSHKKDFTQVKAPAPTPFDGLIRTFGKDSQTFGKQIN